MLAANLDYFGVPALKAAVGRLAERSEADASRIGAICSLPGRLDSAHLGVH